MLVAWERSLLRREEKEGRVATDSMLPGLSTQPEQSFLHLTTAFPEIAKTSRL